MNRFNLAGLLAVSLALALTASAADDKKGHDHHAKEFLACAKACDDCARECDACAAHCAKKVADGKKDHFVTLGTCADCATICRAAAASSARQGPFAGTICTACAEACKRCGDACAKFKDDEMMKKCAEECRKCEKACKEMLKHVEKKE